MGKIVPFLTCFLFICSFIAAFFLPIIHDYSIYTHFWSLYLITSHPYLPYGVFQGNAYGVSSLLFIFPYRISPLFPKAISISAFFSIGLLLYLLYYKTHNRSSFIYWASIFLNPFFYILFLIYGNNEVINAFFIILSLYLFIKPHPQETLAGIILGIGFLFKFIPIVLVPFFFIGPRAYRIHFLLAFLITVFVGTGIGYILYGNEIWIPFLYTFQRNTTFFSVFYPLQHITHIDIAFLGLPIALTLLGITFLLHNKNRYNSILISLVVLLELFLFFKVNLPQYYVNIIMLGLLFIATNKNMHRYKYFIPLIVSYAFYLGAVMMFYLLLGEFRNQWEWIRNSIGLLHFIISVGILGVVTQYMIANKAD